MVGTVSNRNPRGPQDENAHGYFVVQCSVAAYLKYPPQYAEGSAATPEEAAVIRDRMSQQYGFAYAVFDAQGKRVEVGTPNNCDHPNEELMFSDPWTRYYKCVDCGAETQEDR